MWCMGKEETMFAFLVLLMFASIYIFVCFFAFEENIWKEMVKATYTEKLRLPECDQVPEKDLKG